jgi:hypothetical protein
MVLGGWGMDDSLLTKLDDDRWLLLGNDLMEPILSASLRVVIAERDALREENGRLKEERDHYRTLWITVTEESAELRRRSLPDDRR